QPASASATTSTATRLLTRFRPVLESGVPNWRGPPIGASLPPLRHPLSRSKHEMKQIYITGRWMQPLQGVADGWVRPHVDKAFALAQIGQAQTYIEQRK